MKKTIAIIFAILIIATLTIGLVACGETNSNSNNANQADKGLGEADKELEEIVKCAIFLRAAQKGLGAYDVEISGTCYYLKDDSTSNTWIIIPYTTVWSYSNRETNEAYFKNGSYYFNYNYALTGNLTTSEDKANAIVALYLHNHKNIHGDMLTIVKSYSSYTVNAKLS